jgi:hypothetical protein
MKSSDRRRSGPRGGTEDPGREGPPPPDTETDGAVGTPGLRLVQQAVAFTNAQLLDAPAGLELGGGALVDQAAGMMVQDLRGFLQSMEMLLLAAAAKGIEKSLDDDPAGARTLDHVRALMTDLPAFASGIRGESVAARDAPA